MSCLRLLVMLLVALPASLLAASNPLPAAAATFTVNNTEDTNDGACDATHCSLAEAAELSQSGDTIAFNIPPSDPGYDAALGVWTIRPTTLYGVGEGVTINGATQTANRGDSNPLGPEVEVDGSGHADVCFRLSNGDVLRGLVINDCRAHGVAVRGSNIVVAGNYIGTDPTGTLARPIGLNGIFIFHASNNTIGGTTADDRNLISGNDGAGVHIEEPDSEGNRVIGNYIGTDRSGTVALGNRSGVVIRDGARNNTIGGDTAGERNVISGSVKHGVHLLDAGTDNNLVKGNYIGTDAAGTGALANAGFGVAIFNGPTNNVVGPGNVIAYSGLDGVLVDGSDGTETVGNRITGNSIHSNSRQGINLMRGGNGEPAPPLITAVGSASGTACAGCTVEVFSDAEDEGRVFEGSTVADGGGNWSLNGAVTGPNVTATASDAEGNTSEFSAVAASRKWGDIDCNGLIKPADSTQVLQHDAGQTPTPKTGCPRIGTSVTVGGTSWLWGDVDCNGLVKPADSTQVLQHDAGQTPNPKEGCPKIGSDVTLGEP